MKWWSGCELESNTNSHLSHMHASVAHTFLANELDAQQVLIPPLS
jgi:hypothetical protein